MSWTVDNYPTVFVDALAAGWTPTQVWRWDNRLLVKMTHKLQGFMESPVDIEAPEWFKYILQDERQQERYTIQAKLRELLGVK